MTQQELELPKGWIETELGFLANYINGRAFKPEEWEEKGRPIIRIQNLTKTKTKVNRFSGNIEKKYLIRDGDILISWSATLGCFIHRGEESVLNQHIFKVEPFIEKQFLFHLVTYILSQLKQKVHGSGMQHITKGKFDSHPVLLSPLNEQKRIVSKIEELFSNIDSTKQSLEHAKLQLELYRQSLLKFAFEGKHTKEWTHINLESISKLITKGSTPTTHGYDYLEKGINFVKVENVMNGQINKNSIVEYISNDAYNFLKRSQLEENDILFSIAGTIGRTCIVKKGDLPANTNQAIAIIRCKWELILPKLLRLILDSPVLFNSFSQNRRGVGMDNVSLGDIKRIIIPLPTTLEEQEQIVSQIEQGFSLIENSQRIVNSTLQTLETMRMSVLKQAFQGKLVPQDPNDEPASILLENIKKAQADLKPKKRRVKNVK